MPNGVTHFSSKIKCTQTDGRYQEINYGPLDLVQVLTQSTSVGASVLRTNVGANAYIATGDGSSTSNIAGLAPTSGAALDFLMRIPANYDTASTSYVDVYYLLTGAGTKGDKVSWTGAYNSCSVNATTTALATATTTTGITNPSQRTLATGKANGFVYKDSITIAPSTFTADAMPQFRVTALGTYTQPELRIAKIVHRSARAFL